MPLGCLLLLMCLFHFTSLLVCSSHPLHFPIIIIPIIPLRISHTTTTTTTKIYDCDFNQQLGLGLGVTGGRTVFDIESTDDLLKIRVKTDNHCFGCTAGMGSS